MVDVEEYFDFQMLENLPGADCHTKICRPLRLENGELVLAPVACTISCLLSGHLKSGSPCVWLPGLGGPHIPYISPTNQKEKGIWGARNSQDLREPRLSPKPTSKEVRVCEG